MDKESFYEDDDDECATMLDGEKLFDLVSRYLSMSSLDDRQEHITLRKKLRTLLESE